jgi:hypothetical protein
VFYGFTVRLVGAPFFFACKKPVGARLAREGVGTFSIDVAGRSPSRASLAPTGHHAIHSYRISLLGQR